MQFIRFTHSGICRKKINYQAVGIEAGSLHALPLRNAYCDTD